MLIVSAQRINEASGRVGILLGCRIRLVIKTKISYDIWHSCIMMHGFANKLPAVLRYEQSCEKLTLLTL